MLLENISFVQLTEALAPHMKRAPWPGSDSAEVKQQARQYAQNSSLWEQLSTELENPEEINVLPFSSYMEYHRTGSRKGYEDRYRDRIRKTEAAALAVWLEHPAANFDYLQDLLWAWCDCQWQYPAHDRLNIELVSSTTGLLLAELNWLFRDRLDPRVTQRISQEVQNRLLNIAHDPQKLDYWTTTHNNWNTVCNGHLIQTAFYEMGDARQLAAFIHPLFRRMDYAISYFTPDGGCPEGPGYWAYGFGAFLEAALVLLERTGGQINLAQEPRMERICRFPLAFMLRKNQRATFGDSGNGYLGAYTALLVNRFYSLPELYRFIEPTTDGLPLLKNIRGLSLYRGEQGDRTEVSTDHHLKDLDSVKIYAGQTILAVNSGSNDRSHNHNDLGSFIVMLRDTAILCDPGSPVYSAKTFSGRRYELLFCRSRGHSVPLLNGREQPAGAGYVGVMEATGLNQPGEKKVRIDLTRAYDDPTLKQLIREFTLAPSGQVEMVDTFEFDTVPGSLEEAFVTFEDAILTNDGMGVRIGNERDAMLLQCAAPGRFQVEEFTPEQHEGNDDRIFRRIAFRPELAERSFALRFVLEDLHPIRNS